MIRDWNHTDFAELIKKNWIAFKEYYREGITTGPVGRENPDEERLTSR